MTTTTNTSAVVAAHPERRVRAYSSTSTDLRLVYRSGTDDANPSFTTWQWG